MTLGSYKGSSHNDTNYKGSSHNDTNYKGSRLNYNSFMRLIKMTLNKKAPVITTLIIKAPVLIDNSFMGLVKMTIVL